MTETLRARIEALDDKQAVFIVNNLVQAVFSTSPQLRDLDDDQQMKIVTTRAAELARDAGQVLPMDNVAGTIPATQAGEFAKVALIQLTAEPGGDEIVTRALDTWFDRTADFGFLSVSAGIALVWFVGAADIELTIGGLKIIKKGSTAAAKQLVAALVGLTARMLR